ncbi:DUF2974 domain-containing protein [Lysobacter sp. GX 14042]|uniref:Mbeg1-like protein n=1 Tax=Lysobacter sp. GX 14042 TaxID=2907155 RepID=UPI001F182B2D|nr:Mbeg1-like protein [Lysobacter sp. GX 14042]MCE7032543.1 DUF2974 domain-containing protein [Lysobacter sp. GX 14042]
MNMPIANPLSVADQVRIQQHLAHGIPLPPQLQQIADNYPKGDGGFASQVGGQQPQPDTDLQLAMMANDVYDADNPQTAQALDEAGWTRLEPSADGGSLVDAQGNEIPIDPAMLSTTEGFDAAIYQNDQGQYVVAFRGTDNWVPGERSDLDDNLGQGLGFETGQYRDAVALGKLTERVFGEGNVVFTGHSLGGGLASAASLATDTTGVTFNAAGLSDQTLELLGFNPNEVRAQAADDGQIRRYIVNGDPLNGAQQDIPLIPLLNMSPPNAVGHELRIDPPAGLGALDMIGLHGGGGDGASYIEALRQNAAYDPSTRPTAPEAFGTAVSQGADFLGDAVRLGLTVDGHPLLGTLADQAIDAGGEVLGDTIGVVGNIGRDSLERYGEFNLNQLGSAIRQGQELVGGLADNGSGLLDGLAASGREFADGNTVKGTLQAAGDLADFAVDSAGDIVDGVIGMTGDTVHNLANGTGGILRDIGGHTGLEAPLDAVAGFVENTGKVASDVADTVGDAVDSVADAIGDGVEKVADVAGDVGQAINNGLGWLGLGGGR